jgi:hypothetical protein
MGSILLKSHLAANYSHAFLGRTNEVPLVFYIMNYYLRFKAMKMYLLKF